MKTKSNGHRIFGGRTLVIATMHQKEKVIAPLLENELGVSCITIPSFNTDVFGTFSGEIERQKSPLETARLKAFAALKLSDATLVIASEGSFGNHPSSIFMSANEELVILIDTENKLEIIGRFLTTKTNIHQQEIKNLRDLEDFKTTIGFPEHGLILRIEHLETQKRFLYKDFKSSLEINEKIHDAIAKNYKITAETDMRAMNNPTRMEAIEQAVINLIVNCKRFCPSCNTPGFSILKAIPGLPCALCRTPTKSAKAYLHKCQLCDYQEERLKKDSIFEDPTFCDSCNP